MFTAKLHLKPVRKILADSDRRQRNNVKPLSARHVVIVSGIKMSEVIKTSAQRRVSHYYKLSEQVKHLCTIFVTKMQLVK